ncbi:MAG TPA: hypothetical protein VM537_35045 [Anaerolineae bacterium]|nr:hypothetical protein [Anaerolineae bacterium]
MSTVSALLSIPTTIFQVGQGIQSNRQAKKVSDEIEAAAQTDAQLLRREGILRRRDRQANLGGVGLEGSPINAFAEDAMLTEYAASRVIYAAKLRQDRIEAEGRANLITGIAGGVGSLTTGLSTLLDIPGPSKTSFGPAAPDLGDSRHRETLPLR